MLYRINLPTCTQHLEWIVQLQSDLLVALCNADVNTATVTIDWVKDQRPDVNEVWLEKFCSWEKKEKTILVRMQGIAILPFADKQSLIDHYNNNMLYTGAFNDTVPQPPAIMQLPSGLSVAAADAYREYFEMFYAPIFYRAKGYPVDAVNQNNRFSKDEYLDAYHAVNQDLSVCPLCDGSMDGAECDHWLAQKHLPELNCHPQNLIEICGACNKRANKGEKPVFDQGAADPFNNWFHPHLRPAVGLFEIKIEHGEPKLVSDDPPTQVRLDKFDRLVNLRKRWKNEYRSKFKAMEQRIRGHRRQGITFDSATLRTKLESWKIDAESEKGISAYKLLEARFLSSALEPGADSFMELYTYATDI